MSWKREGGEFFLARVLGIIFRAPILRTAPSCLLLMFTLPVTEDRWELLKVEIKENTVIIFHKL